MFDFLGFDIYELVVNCVQFFIFIIIGIGYECDDMVLDCVFYICVKIFIVVVEYFINYLYDIVKVFEDYVLVVFYIIFICMEWENIWLNWMVECIFMQMWMRLKEEYYCQE